MLTPRSLRKIRALLIEIGYNILDLNRVHAAGVRFRGADPVK